MPRTAAPSELELRQDMFAAQSPFPHCQACIIAPDAPSYLTAQLRNPELGSLKDSPADLRRTLTRAQLILLCLFCNKVRAGHYEPGNSKQKGALICEFDQIITRRAEVVERAVRRNEAFPFECVLCHRTFPAFCFYGNDEHILPQVLKRTGRWPASWGNVHRSENIARACVPCNSIKGDRLHPDLEVLLAAGKPPAFEDALRLQWQLLDVLRAELDAGLHRPHCLPPIIQDDDDDQQKFYVRRMDGLLAA